MISIRIGTSERSYHEASRDWITQQIDKRRREGQEFSVEIVVGKGDVNMVFSTPGKRTYQSVPRPLTAEESKIQNLWQKYELSKSNFSISNLLSFINDIGEFS